ncbi:MAG TPA: TetR/AcrR family transcriptional regulator [Acidimicrobiia bacterium]|nr:TetR/AcrR family transcriptional regulator [Acidimicrobiia bacterium]
MATNDLVRRRIFTSAISCFKQYGLRRTTMDDVAAAAGVSRKTVYNYFVNKTGLVAEVIFDEARRVNARARRTLDLDRPGPALLVEAELALLVSARKSPYIDILLNPGDFGATAEVIDRSERVAAVQHEYWDPILDRLAERGELPADLSRTEIVEWLTFVHVGLCARASAFGGDRDHIRRMLTRYVATGLVSAAAQR